MSSSVLAESPSLSFREKSAWISFVLLLLVIGTYAWIVATRLDWEVDTGRSFWIWHNLIFVFLALQIVLHVAVAIRAPRDATRAKDERERLIELKATRVAFFVLIAGSLGAITTLHFGAGVWFVGNSVLMSIFLAWMVKVGGQIIYYRYGV